jgi:hypothetical protein
MRCAHGPHVEHMVVPPLIVMQQEFLIDIIPSLEVGTERTTGRHKLPRDVKYTTNTRAIGANTSKKNIGDDILNNCDRKTELLFLNQQTLQLQK